MFSPLDITMADTAMHYTGHLTSTTLNYTTYTIHHYTILPDTSVELSTYHSPPCYPLCKPRLVSHVAITSNCNNKPHTDNSHFKKKSN